MQYTNTPLAKLARYYLSCIDQNGNGISVPATSRDENLDYAELAELPSIGNESLFDGVMVQRLLGKMRKDRSRLTMYLGYPCALMPQSKKSGWSRHVVEPVFLCPVELDVQSATQPDIDLTFPAINQSVLKRFTNTNHEMFVNELGRLEDDLGLTDAAESPELSELAYRLSVVRPEWPWVGIGSQSHITTDPPLTQIHKEGIYNRVVLIIGERSTYTQGLESELKELTDLREQQYQDTALGQWLNGEMPEVASEPTDTLIEVLPMNSEQRDAIQHAMTQNLTVITGPPGTGKSQVVANLLINATWQGKRVLFASKNNKAVDVVEFRVNNLGSRPILLRVGSNQYQAKLAEYLLSLLSATSTANDRLVFDESCAIHKQLEDKIACLDDDLAYITKLRNQVDVLERATEDARDVLPSDIFNFLDESRLKETESAVSRFCDTLYKATRTEQPFFTRMLWKLIKKARFAKLSKNIGLMRKSADKLLAPLPKDQPTDTSIHQWQEFMNASTVNIDLAKHINKYTKALQELQTAKPMESIAREQFNLMTQFASNAEVLWKNWLRLQPSKLSQPDRALLIRYSTLLKMVIDTPLGERLERSVYGQYASLFSKIAHLLPCWAVTSLSAKGRLPFKPGFFDIVVFDEASQCDIASALPLLYRAKRAVVIGDLKQLSHISGLQRGKDQQLMQKHDLFTDYLNWAYSYTSLFELATSMVASENIVNLRDHHRSHADIIEFSNRFFYERRLRIATRYENLRLPTNGGGIRFIDIKGKVERPNSGSAFNDSEAKVVIQTLRNFMVEQDYSGTVGVVSPFRAQANLMRELVNQDQELEKRLINADFLVDTVHKFQGDERDLMIFSPVLSNGISSSAIRFLRENVNLFNVAITRARAVLLVVGDRSAMLKSDVSYLQEFISYVASLEQEHRSRREPQVDDLGPQYPVVSNPERVSDWEKILYAALYKAGIRTLPQYQVEKYTLDIVAFSGGKKLNIEVDGERYHRNWDGELCRIDQIRNHRMFELGWDVMRFWVYAIRDDLEGCISRVAEWIDKNA